MLGSNVKITAPEAARTQARAVFECLGARLVTPSDRMDVFAFDGSNVGFEYAEEALTPEQMRSAPWLELVVADVAATVERLTALGLERLAYRDTAHPYFVGPAGVVFRLAARAP